MILRRGFTLVVIAFSFTLSAFAREGKIIVANKASKELKRTAARLRLPVEQVKNARHALQEATDLTKRMDPYPIDQIYSLAQNWHQLNRSKANTVIESFIRELWAEASESPDFEYYQKVTIRAQMLIGLLAQDDYEYGMSLIQNWPDPPASSGDAAENFRKSMETQVKRGILSQMAHSNPEKALELLSDPDNSDAQSQNIALTVLQLMMNAGKKEEALKLIDQKINNFAQSFPDQSTLRGYENFIRMTAYHLDSDRLSAALDPLLEQLTNQEPTDDCNGKLEMGDISMDLTCAESTTLSLLLNLGMRPELLQRTIDSVPGLESKLNAVGGIDNFLSNGRYGDEQVTFTRGSHSSPRRPRNTSGRTIIENPAKLLKELQGKAESNPVYVRRRLREAAENSEGINILINVATMAAYQDSDLGALALDIARELLPRIESLQKRSMTLQNIIRAYRRIEGENDIELLRNGYILADQMRQEQSPQNTVTAKINPPSQGNIAQADQLEIFLISEFSRDSFESAILYIHSMEKDAVKLASLIRIVQALGQPNY